MILAEDTFLFKHMFKNPNGLLAPNLNCNYLASIKLGLINENKLFGTGLLCLFRITIRHLMIRLYRFK